MNFLISVLMTLPAMSLAIWYPYVGKLGALLAAFTTMLVVYFLPLSTFIQAAIIEKRTKNYSVSEKNADLEQIDNFNDDFIA